MELPEPSKLSQSIKLPDNVRDTEILRMSDTTDHKDKDKEKTKSLRHAKMTNRLDRFKKKFKKIREKDISNSSGYPSYPRPDIDYAETEIIDPNSHYTRIGLGNIPISANHNVMNELQPNIIATKEVENNHDALRYSEIPFNHENSELDIGISIAASHDESELPVRNIEMTNIPQTPKRNFRRASSMSDIDFEHIKRVDVTDENKNSNDE